MEPNPKLQFRVAKPADMNRILEIIRAAQARMRARGSAQWQDGYPALRDIGNDLDRGCGVVALEGFSQEDTPDGGPARASGFEPDPQNRICGSSMQDTAGIWKRCEIDRSAPEKSASVGPQERETASSGKTETESSRTKTEEDRIVAYAALVFDGEAAYDALDGKWLTDGPYVAVHRLAVADEAIRRGVATAFMRHTETVARAEGIPAFRIDTARDNRPMLRMLHNLGFVFCGIVRYRSGTRLAYEKRLDRPSATLR